MTLTVAALKKMNKDEIITLDLGYQESLTRLWLILTKILESRNISLRSLSQN